MANLTQQESRPSATTTTIPPVFPYGLPSYGTTVVSMPDSKMKKRSASHMSAAVRQQADVHGLLARRRVQEMRDLQLIQPRTPSQLLQVAHHRTEDLDLVRRVRDLGHMVIAAPRPQ